MLRASRSLAGLLLSLCVAACGSDVTVGSSELESLGTGGGPDGSGPDGGIDASGDELARVAREMEGSWTGSFFDLVLTLHFKPNGDRGGTLQFDCMRGDQECVESSSDAGPSGPPAKGNGKYWILEQVNGKVGGVFTFPPIPAAAAFTLDPAKNMLSVSSPLLIVTSFTKDDASDAGKAR